VPAGGEPPPDNSNPAPAPPEQPPEAPPPPAPVEAPVLRWPAWYPNVDNALAVLTLVLAFAAASFVARNSDLWLNLATGKRLFSGQYTPGSDPFSYTAADRAWVNHNWLYDAGAYLLFGGKGIALVVAKALAVTLAFGLLIAVRRPQFPLWPWAACATLAVLAAAPQFTLRPLVASIVFLAVTVFLLFRLPHKPGSWRFPVSIGVTFWLWAQFDQWFFVGPLALALLLLGDFVQLKLLNAPDAPPAEGADEPLGRLPDTATLLKALGVGVLACMLTPHHFRVWELPIELTKPAFADADPRLRLLLFGPTDGVFVRNPGYGYNLNGFAYAALFLAGSVALGFGPGRVRGAHVALFVGFAGLSLVSMYAIPLFAVVAAPLVAAQLNAASAGAELKSWGDPRSRLLYLGSTGGRVVSLLVLVALCVVAYPGWVHPDTSYQPYVRRVAWGVEPDPAMVAAAEQFGAWRASGKLPADARGFVANLELANYLAWYAPDEKVFANGRYSHHARELPDYVTVRKGLRLIDPKDEPAAFDATAAVGPEAEAVLKQARAEYVAVHASAAEGALAADRAAAAVLRMHCKPAEFAPWYVDGRTAVFGWAGTPGAAFAALRADPVRVAFGPDVRPTPDVAPDLPPPELGWEEAFVRPPRPGPAAAAEVLGWRQYKQGLLKREQDRQLIRERLVGPWFFGAPATEGTLHRFAVSAAGGGLSFPPNARTDAGPTGVAADAAARVAVPVLALRAARRAIAADPDHPDGYYALYVALTDADLPLSEGERTLGRVAALRQCLDRMPKPDRYKRGQYLAAASDVALSLAREYLGGDPVPGPPDPKTKQPTIRGFLGMPVEVAPLNVVLGQVVFENPRAGAAPLARYAPDMIQRGLVPRNLQPISTTPFFLPLDAALEVMTVAMEYLPLDIGGELSDEGKKQVARLDGWRKEVEAALVRANEVYGQTKARGAELPTLVEAARAAGLAGEAYRLLSQDPEDVAKAYKEGLAGAAVTRVSLALGLGRVESAHAALARYDEPDQVKAAAQAQLTPVVRLLKYNTALAAGEYKRAGDVFGEGARVGVEPILAAAERARVGPNDMLYAALAGWPPLELNRLWPSAAFQLTAADRGNRALQLREGIAEQLRDDARYFHQRGVLSVLEGDVAAARRWFGQSLREPPPGWQLSKVVHPDAPRYLALIEQAERAGKP
jgi:hypothetical protein